jgi:branched-chain amino acid transport system permease protein
VHSSDRQHLVYARFNTEKRAEIRQLITAALIEEHRRKPLGQGSDALERVKNFFSRPPSYALYSRVPMREWQLIRVPVKPGAPPTAPGCAPPPTRAARGRSSSSTGLARRW